MSSARIAAVAVLLFTGGSVWWWRPGNGVVLGDGGPLPGASVRFQGARSSVLTDQHGRFEPPPNVGNSRRITAWRQGYAIGSAPAEQLALTIQLLPLPAFDNDDYQWLDPTPNFRQPLNCGNCHAAIHQEWSISGHARAATNPHFLAEYQKLATDRPDDIGVCAKCHAPTYRDPALDYDLRKVQGVDRQGVHCDFCHKVVEAAADKLGTRFGVDGYELLRPRGGQQLFFGPLDDAVREGEQFGYAPLYGQSKYCASCHEGVIYGVHVYGTYSEWLASPARQQGKQCQTCHMAPTGKLTNIAPGQGGVERDPRTLGSHKMPGAATEMLRRCLSLKASVRGRQLDVEVLADNVGHRVPTGFIDRNLVLVVEAFDEAGQPVSLASGQTLPPSAGPFVGLPGKIFAKQLVVAKTITAIPFWKVHDDVIDTRLLPGQADRLQFQFMGTAQTVRVRLHFRRFWTGSGIMVCEQLLHQGG
jgi:hypothetical protein